ncbi:actin cytoskeleton-regulatory complex protein pan1-like [Oryza brachyantha]|uniref:actin cytoskeleton-regulatory complex protein pan1-like n=1 Tax=Oryza brachyantha TaxID=4533 RepID=UPI001ADA9BF0|nr:actin cytoskeleton-regulatory complex protein pan1-like [Oryza brachyantha]
MDRWWLQRRRPEPAAIDITWVSCRGVKSSVPFHTPCLYASIYVQHASSPSSSSSSSCGRRGNRVKTATDRTGGGNPEWDAPLRLYLPVDSSSSPASSCGERESAASMAASEKEGGLLVRFELKSEVAVLGDVLSATAAVPVAELVADGTTRRVSYQLTWPDGKHPNGVISFSYAFHAVGSSSSSPNSDADDDRSTISSECDSFTPPCPAASRAITTLPPPPTQSASATASPTMYPVIDWPLTEQVTLTPLLLYPPAKVYPPPPPPPPTTLPLFPPPSPASSIYPPTVREPAVSRSSMYPRVDLEPVSCYPPPPPPPTAAAIYGGVCGYAAAPGWDGRCSNC